MKQHLNLTGIHQVKSVTIRNIERIQHYVSTCILFKGIVDNKHLKVGKMILIIQLMLKNIF